jgi:SAM-dependent methyltransferase
VPEQNLDRQYRRPTGSLGRQVGERMAEDHLPENLWTVSLLQARPTDHILELGFGAGVAIQELAKTVTQGRIAGIDFSKTMVAAARRRNAQAIKRGTVDLRYGDVAELPFDDAQFDKAFSIHSIYFWRQPHEVVRGIERVLRPGGRLVLTVLPTERWNERDPDTPIGTPDCRAYSGEELARILEEAGFGAIRIETDSHPSYRSNFSVIGVKHSCSSPSISR